MVFQEIKMFNFATNSAWCSFHGCCLNSWNRDFIYYRTTIKSEEALSKIKIFQRFAFNITDIQKRLLLFQIGGAFELVIVATIIACYITTIRIILQKNNLQEYRKESSEKAATRLGISISRFLFFFFVMLFFKPRTILFHICGSVQFFHLSHFYLFFNTKYF